MISCVQLKLRVRIPRERLPVDFDIAQSLIAVALNEAAKSGFAISIVVLDATTCPVASTQMAGGVSGSVEVAYIRAVSAAFHLGNTDDAGPTPQSQARAASMPQVVLSRPRYHGGIGLRDKVGGVVGWVGVAGTDEAVDEAIARAVAASFVS